MNNNIKIQIQEINRLMNYDRSKSLLEQDTMFTRNLDRIYSKPESAKKYMNDLHKDIHVILPVFAALTFWLPPVSLMFELADAGIYYAEGDKEMAGIALAFSIIPFGELIRWVPGVKQFSTKWLIRALQKSKSGKALSKWEQQAVKEVIDNGRQIARVTQRRFLRLVLSRKYKSLSLVDKIGIMYKIFRTYKGSKLLSLGLQVGGIYYTYKKLGEIFGFLDSPPNTEEIQNIESNWVQDNTDEISEEIENLLFDLSDEERDKAINEFFNLTEEDFSDIKNEIENTTSEIGKENDKVNVIPKNIIDGIMNKGWVIMNGSHNQESKIPGIKLAIEKIQKIVGAKIDGLFGPETESKVKKWQKSKGLKDDGKVGKNTLSKIIENIK